MGTIDTRHAEKTALFALLCAENIDDYRRAASQLMAAMEPEDVEQVRKEVSEYKQGK